MYCIMTSILTKLVHNKDIKKKFFSFIILLKKRISITNNKTKNLISKNDLKMGWYIHEGCWTKIASFSTPGI